MINNKYPNISPSLNLDFTNSNTIDPRITFSRASAATFYDGKTVAKAEENIYTYSQDFSNGIWVKNLSTVVSNSTTAPDGTATASKFVSSPSNGYQYITQSIGSVSEGSQVVISLYAKASEYTKLQISNQSSGNLAVRFDLVTGSVISSSGTNFVSASAVSFGSGWYRCVVVFNKVGTVLPTISGYPDNAILSSYAPSYTGDGTSGIYLWGAQLEQRSQVTDYTPTTSSPVTNYIPVLQTELNNTPRRDHDPVTGECKGLLIEEQRTNLLTYSEQFDNAAWTKANATVSPSAVIAPDGTQTGDKLIEDSSALSHVVNRTTAFIPTSGTVYTTAVYAKAGGRTIVRLQWTDSMASACTVNLTDGSVSDGSAAVTYVGNGWWRIALTTTASGVTPSSLYIAPRVTTGGGSSAYQGNGYSGIYIWGAQLETGSFPTSYIKTEASQVTRAADSASMMGANFSSWYRQDEGTLFLESINEGGVAGGNFGMSDGTNSNRLWVQNDTRTSITQAYVMKESILQSSLALPGVVVNTSSKVAMAYKANDLAATRSGFASVTDNIASIPIVNKALFNAIGQETAATSSGWIRRATYYPNRLSDAQLQALTA